MPNGNEPLTCSRCLNVLNKTGGATLDLVWRCDGKRSVHPPELCGPCLDALDKFVRDGHSSPEQLGPGVPTPIAVKNLAFELKISTRDDAATTPLAAPTSSFLKGA